MVNETDNMPSRAGEAFRNNPDRFFHVMTQGWFIFTREGILGPFVDQQKAKGYLSNHIKDLRSDQDPSSSWRL